MDIQTATQRLAQYQNAPGKLHFDGLVQIAKYLRTHPDLPLCYTKRDNKMTCLNVDMISKGGCWLGDFTISNVEAHQFGGLQTFWPEHDGKNSIITGATQLSLAQKHFSSGPPATIGYADANFGGAVFDRQAYSGGVILMNGTAVITVCCKQSTTAYNTTEAELDAASTVTKRVLWLRAFIDDLGLAYDRPIFIGEDNVAAQLIAHAGKLTRNVRHVATKTVALQEHVRHERVKFGCVTSQLNRADHFTKALPHKSLFEHCSYMMGLRFIDKEHHEATRLVKLKTSG